MLFPMDQSDDQPVDQPDDQPDLDDPRLEKAIREQASQQIRRGFLFLIIGIGLCFYCRAQVEGAMPELTRETMLDLKDPGILYKYGMWASLLVAYIGGVMIYAHRRNLKESDARNDSDALESHN